MLTAFPSAELTGDEQSTVRLPEKMHGYGTERRCHQLDIQTAASLLWKSVAPEEIVLPLPDRKAREYTIEMFTKRNTIPTRELKQLQASEADLMRKQESGLQTNQAALEIIPTTQHILDNYAVLTIAEKSHPWKLVMTKTTVYRPPDSKLMVNIYPNLPK